MESKSSLKIPSINNNCLDSTNFKAKIKWEICDEDLIPKYMKKKYSDFAKTIGTDKDTIIVGLEEDSRLSTRESTAYDFWGRIERPFTCVANGEFSAKRKTISEIFMGCWLESRWYDNKIKEIREVLAKEMLQGLKEIPKAYERNVEKDNINFCKWYNYKA